MYSKRRDVDNNIGYKPLRIYGPTYFGQVRRPLSDNAAHITGRYFSHIENEGSPKKPMHLQMSQLEGKSELQDLLFMANRDLRALRNGIEGCRQEIRPLADKGDNLLENIEAYSKKIENSFSTDTLSTKGGAGVRHDGYSGNWNAAGVRIVAVLKTLAKHIRKFDICHFSIAGMFLPFIMGGWIMFRTWRLHRRAVRERAAADPWGDVAARVITIE
ncbi:hypothetical protein HOY80DRAFT_1006025 [Tuber brumale]|nr:hypothetical protein HOY80DRAFT_1006025 [Tuber brumale]